MQIIKIKFITSLLMLLGVAALAPAFGPDKSMSETIRQPELPPECSTLAVDDGSELIFHAFAIGVQIYRWSGGSWDFVAPQANLYADEGYHGLVATHFVGPTWESNSGSRVVAQRADGCAPDASAIPWLLLDSVSNSGPGIFAKVSHVQRLNTVGGLKPSAPGSTVGEEARIPYMAEYFFYKGAE